MIDFGILKAIRHTIVEALPKEAGVGEVYLSYPEKPLFPAVHVQLEEIWTPMLPAPDSPIGKVRLKISSYSERKDKAKSLHVSRLIQKIIEGASIELESGKKGISRLVNSAIQLSDPGRPACVEQMFDVLISPPQK